MDGKSNLVKNVEHIAETDTQRFGFYSSRRESFSQSQTTTMPVVPHCLNARGRNLGRRMKPRCAAFHDARLLRGKRAHAAFVSYG